MVDRHKNIAFWDRVASKTPSSKRAFAGLLSEGSNFEVVDRVLGEQARFEQLFQASPATRVLEVGAGGGRWGFFLSGRVLDYVGLDISSCMVAAAQKEAETRGLRNVKFICATLPEYVPAHKFDLIYFSSVLQYMNDEDVELCISKAKGMLTEGGIIISRDSVQMSHRVEKGGEYPVIYRTETEYRTFFRSHGFHLEYSNVSYEHKRFSGIASRLYDLPGVPFWAAWVVREILHGLDRFMGSPPFLKSSKLKLQLKDPNPQEHRFSRYVLGVKADHESEV